MTTEHTNLKNLLCKAAAPGTILFPYANGLFRTIQGNPITLGVPGVLDLIGYTMVLITPAMVGKSLPVFTAIDAKVGKDRVRQTQADFIAASLKNNCLAGAVKSIVEMKNILNKRLDRDQ